MVKDIDTRELADLAPAHPCSHPIACASPNLFCLSHFVLPHCHHAQAVRDIDIRELADLARSYYQHQQPGRPFYVYVKVANRPPHTQMQGMSDSPSGSMMRTARCGPEVWKVWRLGQVAVGAGLLSHGRACLTATLAP